MADASHQHRGTQRSHLRRVANFGGGFPGCEVSRLPFIGGAACTIGIRRVHQSLSAQTLDESTHMLTGSLPTPPAHPHTETDTRLILLTSLIKRVEQNRLANIYCFN